MDKNTSEIDPAQTMALATELRQVTAALLRRLREQNHPGELTWSQKSVLLRLEREGAVTVTELAKAEGVKPQSMGATVSALEAAGLIAGSPDARDRRRTILSLTERCREQLQSHRAAKQDWIFRALQANFSCTELEEITHAVELLKRLADS